MNVGNKTTGPRLIHRAMLALFMASSFFYTAYNSDNEELAITLGLIGAPLLLLGIHLILKGRKKLLTEVRQRKQNN